jgi:hypothetical protein
MGVRAYLGTHLPRHCYEVASAKDGCISEAVLADAEPPQLRVSWRNRHRTLIIRLRAHGVTPGTVWLRALGKGRGKKRKWRELATWALPADVNRNFVRFLRLPGLHKIGRVCIAASTDRREHCPPSHGSDPVRSAWVRYRVPMR